MPNYIDPEQLAEAIEEANQHMDAEGIPADCLYRKLAHFSLALNMHPEILELYKQWYPNAFALMQ